MTKLLTTRQSLIFFVVLTGATFRAQARAIAATDNKPLVVNAAFAGQTLSPRSQLELRLSRPLLPAEGRLAVFIAMTDVTDLIETNGTRLRYRPYPLPLQGGENRVAVYLVSADRGWKEIASFSFRVVADPLIDLSGYQMIFKFGAANLNAGNVSYGSNRQLINGFASRGL